MYRHAAERPSSEAPPSELILTGGARDRRGSAVAIMQLVGLPAIVAALLSMVDPWLGLAGLVVTAALLVRWWRKPADVVVLRVHDGRIEVSLPPPKKRTVHIALADLSDVALDTRTIRPVSDGGSMIPAMRFIESNVGPEVDKARVVLVRDDDDAPVALTEAHIAHMDATDWLARTRVFLRKNGWTPEDEREA
jgi:hypothetical protein